MVLGGDVPQSVEDIPVQMVAYGNNLKPPIGYGSKVQVQLHAGRLVRGASPCRACPWVNYSDALLGGV